MIKYTMALEGEFITFVGIVNTSTEGIKVSHRKQAVKALITRDLDNFLTLINVDDNTNGYKYTEVEDPDTPGIAFIDLETFRVYMLNNLTIHF